MTPKPHMIIIIWLMLCNGCRLVRFRQQATGLYSGKEHGLGFVRYLLQSFLTQNLHHAPALVRYVIHVRITFGSTKKVLCGFDSSNQPHLLHLWGPTSDNVNVNIRVVCHCWHKQALVFLSVIFSVRCFGVFFKDRSVKRTLQFVYL